MTKPLVFGVGLEKTGTTSLAAALDRLGWNASHSTNRVRQAITDDREQGRPLLSSLLAEGFTAFVDNPIPDHFAELDRLYPGARWINTVRPFDDWTASRLRHKHVTAHWCFEPDKLRRHWDRHQAAVREHFGDRLLTVDICGGDGWEKLCPFLDVPAPPEPFPHANESPAFEFTRDWFTMHIPTWQRLLRERIGKPDVQAVEIGSFEGRSAVWLLLNLCAHESARLTCIDPWRNPDVERRFDRNAELAGRTRKLTKIKARSADVLPTLPAGSFDFAYVDGSHEGRDVMLDGLLAFRLLKPGGVLLFDDYEWNWPHRHHKPKPAIDAFLLLHDDCTEILHRGYQVAVRKTA